MEAVEAEAAAPWRHDAALTALHETNYAPSKAKQKCNSEAPKPWTPEEEGAFLRAIWSHGKSFGMVAKLVGTRSIKETAEHFFNHWHGGEDYDTWRKARVANAEGTTLGVPANAEIVVALQGDLSPEQPGGKVGFAGRCGPSEMQGASEGSSFRYEYIGKREERPAQAGQQDCGECKYCLNKVKYGGTGTLKMACIHKQAESHGNALQVQPVAAVASRPMVGLWSGTRQGQGEGSNEGGEEQAGPSQEAEWPPSGLYRGSFLHEGEAVQEELWLTFTGDAMVRGHGTNSLAGKCGLHGIYTLHEKPGGGGRAATATIDLKKWHLPSKKKGGGATVNQRDNFYQHLWPGLTAAGWKIETGNRPNDLYFLPPHVSTRLAKGYAVRRDYFDSRTQVLNHAETNPLWKEAWEAYQAATSGGAAAREAGEDPNETRRKAYALAFGVKRKEKDAEKWETPPPSPGGHDSICRKCRDGGELIVCDSCPRSFHLLCCNPPIYDEDALPDGDWFCEDCTAKSESVESTLVSPHKATVMLD